MAYFPPYYHDCDVAGEMLSMAEVFLEQQIHPTVIISAYRQALDDIVTITKEKIRYILAPLLNWCLFRLILPAV